MLRLFIKDALLYGGTDFAFKMVSFLTFPVFTHYLSVEDYGVLATAQTLAAFLAIFGLGIHNSLQRFYWESEIPESDRKIFFATLLLSLIAVSAAACTVGAIILYCGPTLLHEWLHLNVSEVLCVLSALIPGQVGAFFLLFFRVKLQAHKFVLFSCLQNGLSILCSLFMVLVLKLGVVGFLLGTFIAQFLLCCMGCWMLRNELILRFRLAYLGKTLRFSYPYAIMALGYWCFSGLDRCMLVSLSGTHAVGLYGVAFKVSSIVTLMTGAFAQSWFPHIFKLHGTGVGAKGLISHLNTVGYMLLAWLLVNVFLFVPEALMLVTPKSYWEAIPVILLVCSAVFYNHMGQVCGLGVTFAGKHIHLAVGTWLGAFLNLCLNLILMPAFGALGAAISTVLCNVVVACYFHFRSQRTYPFPYSSFELGTISVYVFVSLFVGIWLTPHDTISWRIVLFKVIYSGAGLMLPFYLGLLSWKELKSFFGKTELTEGYTI